MITPQVIVTFASIVWLLIAAVVIGYPLIAGRIRAGSRVIKRGNEPSAFWKAYAWSTLSFCCVSIALWFLLHWIAYRMP